MPHYKDQNNKIHVLDSAEYEHLLPAGCVAITDAEAHDIQNPPLTLEQVKAQYDSSIQAHLDAAAVAKGYDNIVSACSYAAAPNPFQAEGIAFITWRGAVWVYCIQLMTDVQTGVKPLPTIADLLAALPPAP